jgi:chemotaxis signal transduction protein
MAEATAWVIELSNGLYAAVGDRQMVHIVEEPIFERIPHTPAHCQHVLLWEDELLPMMDLAAWLTGKPAESVRQSIGVVRWQAHPDTAPQYGALLFTGIPQKVSLRDEQACRVPEQPAGLDAIALSCFRHDDQPVAILDLPHIFSAAFVTDPEVAPALCVKKAIATFGIDESPTEQLSAWN